MDVTTKAVAIRATDYKENDKLVLLYTPDYGKITVHARGVRKGNAKLRYAVDQFCFGSYELAVSGDRYTLKNCEQLDAFYDLRQDIVVYYAACAVAECLIVGTEEGQSDPQLFVELLRALECLVNGKPPMAVVARFVLAFLQMSGFGVNFTRCSACGGVSKRMYLAPHRGALCEGCRTVDSFAVSPIVATTCGLLEGTPYDKLDELDLSLDCQRDVLQLLNKYMSAVFYPGKCISELVKLA